MSRCFISRFFLATLASALVGCAAYGPARKGETIHRGVVFSRPEGRALRVDLYVPKSSKPAPVIVWYHGGSWKYGHHGFHLHVRDLTRDGFAIASVEYRLLGRRNRWPAQFDDSLAAIEWIAANGTKYGIDPKRMGVSGESAGGHLAALVALTKNKPSIDAACVLYAPTDMVGLGRRYQHFGRLSVVSQMFRGNIEERLDLAHSASPCNLVTRKAPPFLIYHGDRDWLVPMDQCFKLHAALRKKQVPSEVVVVKDQGHAFALDDTQLSQVAAFFRKHL
jgi:acetyl esterase/lipase